MKPEEALQTCLQEVEERRKTPAECAAAFPYVPDLEAQLLAASKLWAWSAPTLRPEAYRGIKARLLEQWRALERPRRVAATMRRPSSVLRWATALGLFVILLFAGAGTVAASSHSLPGDALYPVKRTTEAVQLILTPASERASLHAALAQRRLDEIVALTERGRMAPELLNDLAGRLATEMEAALAEVESASSAQAAEVLGAIIRLTDRSQIVLTSLQALAPPQAQAGLAHALEVSSQTHQNAQMDLEQGQPPGDHGSGQSTPGPESQTLTPGEAGPGQTQAPSGQQKKTATVTAAPSRTPRAESPGQIQILEESDTGTPPGQHPTRTVAAPNATQGHGTGGGGGANCSVKSPQASNYCTPTPRPDMPPTSPPESAAPTPCPLNPAGKPVCKP